MEGMNMNIAKIKNSLKIAKINPVQFNTQPYKNRTYNKKQKSFQTILEEEISKTDDNISAILELNYNRNYKIINTIYQYLGR